MFNLSNNPNVKITEIDLFNLHIDEVQDLLNTNKLSINVRNEQQETLLHLSVKHERIDIAQELICRGFDVNACDSKKNRPLHTAIELNRVEFANLLIENDADTHAKNNQNIDPHDLAWKKNRIKIVRLISQKFKQSQQEQDYSSRQHHPNLSSQPGTSSSFYAPSYQANWESKTHMPSFASQTKMGSYFNPTNSRTSSFKSTYNPNLSSQPGTSSSFYAPSYQANWESNTHMPSFASQTKTGSYFNPTNSRTSSFKSTYNPNLSSQPGTIRGTEAPYVQTVTITDITDETENRRIFTQKCKEKFGTLNTIPDIIKTDELVQEPLDLSFEKYQTNLTNTSEQTTNVVNNQKCKTELKFSRKRTRSLDNSPTIGKGRGKQPVVCELIKPSESKLEDKKLITEKEKQAKIETETASNSFA